LNKTIDDFIVHLFTDCIFRLLVVIGHPTPTSGVQAMSSAPHHHVFPEPAIRRHYCPGNTTEEWRPV